MHDLPPSQGSTSPTPPPSTSGVVPAGTVQWTVLCHLSGLLAFNVFLGNLIGPLIIWLTQRAEYPEVDRHGKEVLNFHLSWALYYLIAGPLCLVLIGFPILAVLYVSSLVLTCIGAFKASEGQLYRYPFTIRFLK